MVQTATFFQIKSATRLLIFRCGGVRPVADMTGYSTTQISRWQSDAEKTLVPLTALLVLESYCGDPVITRAIAGIHGLKLSTSPQQRDSVCISDSLANFMGSTSEVVARTGESLRDRVVTPNEADWVLQSVAKAEEYLSTMKTKLSSIKAEGLE